jgi:hypothetical protein
MGDVSPESQYDAGLDDEHAQHAVTALGDLAGSEPAATAAALGSFTGDVP